jgi:hypothetical protein
MRTQKSKDLRWLFGLLFLLGLVLIFKDSSTNSSTRSSVKPSSSQFQQEDPKKLKLVDRHLKETALTLEYDKLMQKQEAKRILNRYETTQKQSAHVQGNSLSFDEDINMQKLTSDLNRSVELSDSELTPEQIIHNELLNKQLLDKANRAYTEAYMQQFIENARAGGWEIKLGPNMEVISVKKIKPRRPSLLNQ